MNLSHFGIDEAAIARQLLSRIAEIVKCAYLDCLDAKLLGDDLLHANVYGRISLDRFVSLDHFVSVRLRDVSDGGVVERLTGDLCAVTLDLEVETRSAFANQAKRTTREADASGRCK